MAGATRKCKVCGKEYEYCHTVRRTSDIFRWQDVACCPEHGSAYFAAVAAARNEASTDTNKSDPASKSNDEVIEEIIDDIDDEYEDDEDDFEDEDDEDEEDDE